MRVSTHRVSLRDRFRERRKCSGDLNWISVVAVMSCWMTQRGNAASMSPFRRKRSTNSRDPQM